MSQFLRVFLPIHSMQPHVLTGNILLHILTSRSDYQLRIDLQDWNGNTTHANYKTFKIGSAYERYRLDIGGYTGDAGKNTCEYVSEHFVNFKTFPSLLFG